VQDERVDVGPELGHDERDALSHQACDKRDVATEPVELRYDDRALEPARSVQGETQLRPQIEGVDALARFDLDVFGRDEEAFSPSEAGDGFALRLYAEARSALLAGGDAQVGDDWPSHVIAPAIF
jgi:hypothetical protein